MLEGYVRPGNITHRTGQQREPRLPSASASGREGVGLPTGRQVLLTLLLLGVLCGFRTPVCFAFGQSDATNPNGHFRMVTPDEDLAAQAPRRQTQAPVHTPHSQAQATQPRPSIEQVRFNQTALSFQHGVTAGPGAGNLEIQFAAPVSGGDRPRYRLLGFDTQWKEVGQERAAVYNQLAPGHYEFDWVRSGSGGARGPVVESIPITVTAPYWQAERFRGVGIMLLLGLVLVLHKLRIRSLVRRTQKLQATVNQTKAELTLAARVAGDAQEALKEQALKDSLTGLWNRRAIFAMLEREVCRAQRDRCPITLVMIDLDHFKKINDTHGHLTGDEVLREAAGRLAEVMRPYDFAGRYGGEEFLVVLPGCSPHNGVQRAEDFRRAIAESPVPTAIGSLVLTCSVGVAAHEEAMPPEDLIQRADEAMYRAKRLGRNCVCAGSEETLPVGAGKA